MSKTLTPASVADEAQYIVALSRSVKLGRSWLRPGDAEIRLKGKIIKEIADAIRTVSEIPQ